ncbi:MAG: NAD(P)-dependent oxidoreductase [bacterium]|nr:NAD(P)-dependent oxidoreductase [bacterium]
MASLTPTPNIFITGGSGCIGHYVVDEVQKKWPNAHLFLMSRDPSRFKLDTNKKTITLVKGSMDKIEELKDVLKDMDYMIHIATEWGDYEHTVTINVDKTYEMLGYLDPKRIKRILYFSTASILGQDNQPVPVAGTDGTPYVRSKYLAYEKLKTHPLKSHIITLFPTLVFGGTKNTPKSHLNEGIPESKKYLKLLRWIWVDSAFHFMHGRDIALVTAALLDQPNTKADYVLGNTPYTERRACRILCKRFKMPIYFQIKVPTWFIFALIKLLRIQLSNWDRHCISNPQFVYTTVTPSSFGLSNQYPQLEDVLKEI